MGLFLGFSFVSIAELIYFAILRPYRAVCQFKKSKDVYGPLENGTHIHSMYAYNPQFRGKVLVKSRKLSPSSTSSTISYEKNRVFKVKNALPFLIENNLDKRWQRNNNVWLE